MTTPRNPNTAHDTHTLARNPEIWDPRSLSRPFVTPTTNLSARAQELELDVGTFCPNQYKSCVESLHYHPRDSDAHTNLLATKHVQVGFRGLARS